MAKVYVSSTVADLTTERKAVIDWLVAAGHQPVHSYKPNSETVRDSCLNDVDGCELYVLILGHRYGFQPDDGNPAKLSITQLEFRRANGKPRVALLRTSIPNIALSDVANPERLKLVQSFREEVQRAVRPAEFSDPQGLIQALSTGVQSELDKLQRSPTTGSAQISQNDPAVLAIIATLTRQIDSKDAENTALRGRVQELEDQLGAAIARTLTVAAQPDASPAAVAAANALESGDTGPAEALLRSQEREEVAQIGSPEVDDTVVRRQAAALAREQGAFAIGHDVRMALQAYQRAAEHEPDDTWTHFFIGDLHMRLGNSKAAMKSYGQGAAVAERRLQVNPDHLDGQRDLSVSHNRIGDVLGAQGDGPGALAAYRKGLAIREALAARDPANTEWQRDLSVSHNKIGDVLGAQGDGPGALAAYRTGLAIREALAARDPASAQWQTDVAVSCAKLGTLEQGQDVDARRDYLMRGRDILVKLKEAGRLMPNQDWIGWFDEQIAQLRPGQE